MMMTQTIAPFIGIAAIAIVAIDLIKPTADDDSVPVALEKGSGGSTASWFLRRSI